MKYKIYNDEKKDKEETCTLRLMREDRYIQVVAVDHLGERVPLGTIVSFNKEGLLIMHPNISKDIGFQLDGHGCIQISK